MPKKIPLFIIICAFVLLPTAVLALSKNGFFLDNANVPVDEILSGGPPRDGIPAIDEPKFLTIDKAEFMKDQDRILGIVMSGEAKAYPIKILDWHEIVNDNIGEKYFAVTYCPLCGTGMAFVAKAGNQRTEFGVSGLLYQSDVLLYDRATESLWSQIKGEAVSGELVGEKLEGLPVYHTSWKDWIQRYPDTLVLSTDTGHRRDYTRSPYEGYETSRRIYFSVSNKAPEVYHPKEQVMGVEIKGQVKAYPYVELEKNGASLFVDEIGGESVQIHWESEARSAYITTMEGEPVVSTIAFWFAWFTFHPDTKVFTADSAISG